MEHDSRRWTGRYKPGEGDRPLLVRRRSVRWLLGSQMLFAMGLAVSAVLDSPTPGFSIYFFLCYFLMIRNPGLSPFNHGFFLQLEDHPCHDEFERSALERATRFAYAAIVLLVLVVLLLFAGVRQMGWAVTSTSDAWMACAGAFLVVAFTLPVFIAEIMIPFPRESTEGAL